MAAITRRELQSYVCQTCKAKPGEPCRTRLTSVPTEPHQARWRATFAGRATAVRNPELTRQINEKMYGEPEREVKVHFIYNAAKRGHRRNLWCSCHTRFGEDLEAAQAHLLDAHGIPGWLAGLGSDVERHLTQLVIDGMLRHDEDPTDTALFVKYRDWLLGGLGQRWVDKLDAQ